MMSCEPEKKPMRGFIDRGREQQQVEFQLLKIYTENERVNYILCVDLSKVSVECMKHPMNSTEWLSCHFFTIEFHATTQLKDE